MTSVIYTEEQVVARVGSLTEVRLRRFIEAECVIPKQAENRAVFTEADLARLELLCELRDDFDFDDDALAVVLSLIDQVHGMRRQLRLVLRALETEPEDVRTRIKDAMKSIEV